MYSTPRFLSSFMTRSQNLAPSFCFSLMPRISFSAVATHAQRDVDGFVADQAFVADLDPQGIEKDQRIGRLERPGLPGGDLLEHGISHRADQVR
jgi:hypothetical protein